MRRIRALSCLSARTCPACPKLTRHRRLLLHSALASDTGGSTRLPAAYCGIVGLKPSYGLLSRWGMIAYASSLDCVGLMAQRVEDVQVALGEWRVQGPSIRPMQCPCEVS